MQNQSNTLKKSRKKKNKRNEPIETQSKDRSKWKSFFCFAGTFAFFYFHVNMQRLIIAPEALVFGFSAFYVLFIFYILLLAALILVFDYRSHNLIKRFPVFWFVGIGLPIMLFLSSFYYCATDKGLYYQRFLNSRFVPWNQVEKVILSAVHRGGRGRNVDFKYLIVTDNGEMININAGKTYGDIEEIDAILESKKAVFVVDVSKSEWDYVEDDLSYTEKALLLKHRQAQGINE